VLLLGLLPGATTVSVWSASGRTDYPVTVTRFPTLQTWDDMVQLDADHPRTFRVPSLTRVAVGDASMCEAIVTGDGGLELRPRRAGRTAVLVWTGGHRRQVLVTVVSGGVVRSTDDFDAVLTEPLDGRVVLIAGEQWSLAAPALTQFAVIDPTVARVRVRPGGRGELVIEGQRAGATRVLVWNGKSKPETHFVVVHARSPFDPPESFEWPPPGPVPSAPNL
jgi:Flp pilus assembly secretin CpaC